MTVVGNTLNVTVSKDSKISYMKQEDNNKVEYRIPKLEEKRVACILEWKRRLTNKIW